MLYQVHLTMNSVRTQTLVVIGTDCIGSCKSNYHTITTTTAPVYSALGQIVVSIDVFILRLHPHRELWSELLIFTVLPMIGGSKLNDRSPDMTP